MSWIITLVIFCLLLGFVIFLRRAGGGSFPWLHFYIRGKESGFSFKEVNMLRKVAVENRLENPTALFWSIKQLDRSIRGIALKFQSEGKINQEPYASFLSKLFDFRKSVEFNQPKYKLGLKTTRKLEPRQWFKIFLPGVGTYSAQIVENIRKYIAISYPVGPKLPPGFVWRGRQVQVYFWRYDDAGYLFETKILEDFSNKQYPILYLSHSESLTRSQKRGSIRVDINIPGYLFTFSSIKLANETQEPKPGFRCRIKDISEDGAAIIVGGRGKPGLPIKIQFKLMNRTIVMPGIVKNITFNHKKNQSVLHIQAVPLSPVMKNSILFFVYNLFKERDTLSASTSNRKAGSGPGNSKSTGKSASVSL